MGATWDRALVRQEARSPGARIRPGLRQRLLAIMDVLRDPRGAAPWIATERIRSGLRTGHRGGARPAIQGVVSTMKHLRCIPITRAREGEARTDPQIAPREMEMLHLWPFER